MARRPILYIYASRLKIHTLVCNMHHLQVVFHGCSFWPANAGRRQVLCASWISHVQMCLFVTDDHSSLFRSLCRACSNAGFAPFCPKSWWRSPFTCLTFDHHGLSTSFSFLLSNTWLICLDFWVSLFESTHLTPLFQMPATSWVDLDLTSTGQSLTLTGGPSLTWTVRTALNPQLRVAPRVPQTRNCGSTTCCYSLSIYLSFLSCQMPWMGSPRPNFSCRFQIWPQNAHIAKVSAPKMPFLTCILFVKSSWFVRLSCHNVGAMHTHSYDVCSKCTNVDFAHWACYVLWMFSNHCWCSWRKSRVRVISNMGWLQTTKPLGICVAQVMVYIAMPIKQWTVALHMSTPWCFDNHENFIAFQVHYLCGCVTWVDIYPHLYERSRPSFEGVIPSR